MQNVIDLTDFQNALLIDVISKRQKALENENDAMKMVFAAHGAQIPENSVEIKIENKKLIWEKTEDVK